MAVSVNQVDITVDITVENVEVLNGNSGDVVVLTYEGLPGLSAYEVALKNGYSGTEAEWLDSLQGTGGGGTIPEAIDGGNF